jgi:plasmid stabilization system protein ParE
MKHNQGFELHPGAAQDITEIWQFIAEDSPPAATRFREDILEAIRKLASLPRQGRQRPDLTSQPLRFQTIRDYLIVYAPPREAPPRYRHNSWPSSSAYHGSYFAQTRMNRECAVLSAAFGRR